MRNQQWQAKTAEAGASGFCAWPPGIWPWASPNVGHITKTHESQDPFVTKASNLLLPVGLLFPFLLPKSKCWEKDVKFPCILNSHLAVISL